MRVERRTHPKQSNTQQKGNLPPPSQRQWGTNVDLADLDRRGG